MLKGHVKHAASNAASKAVIIIIFLAIILLVTSCSEDSAGERNKGQAGVDSHHTIGDGDGVGARDVGNLDGGLTGELIIALDPGKYMRVNDSTLKDPADFVYFPILERVTQFMELHPQVSVQLQLITWYEESMRTKDKFSPDFTVMPDIIELTPHQVRWMGRDALQELGFYIEFSPHEVMQQLEYKRFR